jgi:hypothetical protein
MRKILYLKYLGSGIGQLQEFLIYQKNYKCVIHFKFTSEFIYFAARNWNIQRKVILSIQAKLGRSGLKGQDTNG